MKKQLALVLLLSTSKSWVVPNDTCITNTPNTDSSLVETHKESTPFLSKVVKGCAGLLCLGFLIGVMESKRSPRYY